MRKELEKVLIEKDFLERNNQVLKLKHEESTREQNKPFVQSRLKTEFSRFHDYELLEDIEDFYKENRPMQKQKRSTSSEKSKVLKKKNGSQVEKGGL